MNTKDITADRANILLVGDSGTHKTFFAGECPKPYIFDFDAGTAILRNKSIEYDIFKDIPLAVTGARREPTPKEKERGSYGFGSAWAGFIKKLNDIGTSMDNGTCPYETLVFDSLTMMSEIALNAAMWEQDKKLIHQGTYGAQIAYIKTVMSQITAWPIRIVCTAHIQRDINDVMQRTEKLPLLTGKLAGLIGVYFDEVYFCNSDGKGNYTVSTSGSAELKQAKSRWGVPDGTKLDYSEISKYFGSPLTPKLSELTKPLLVPADVK